MKNLILILLCLGLTGCVSSTVSRGVNETENIYYSSSSPNIKLQFPEYATYNKGKVGQMSHRFRLGNSYVYIHFISRPANETQVDYYNNPETWMFSNVPLSEKLSKGTLTILNKKWYFCNSLKEEGRSSYFIRDIGYFDPSHSILYVRFVRPLTDIDKQILSNHEYLTNEQYKLMQEIIEDFNYSVKITNFVQEEIQEATTPVTAKLKILKQSYEADLITKDEYEAKKSVLLDAL
ncbi:MAG: SHOCT domain-containing protein [Desulfobulbaceae bacterium]|nr:SHOCT domain-containing protein [Desulfobulbaceae bacterium]